MDEYLELFLQILQNIKYKKDITYLISTKDKHTAMISIKEGQISYLRYGSLSGTTALNAFLGMEVENFVERSHSLGHSKIQRVLPETREILQKLCTKLPKGLGEYQADLEPTELASEDSKNSIHLESSDSSSQNPEVSSVTSNTGLKLRFAIPIEPKSTVIPDFVIPTLKSALQQAVGPISDLIYDDAFAEINRLEDRGDLAFFIDILIREIDEDEYQKQFIDIVKDQLAGIILVKC